MRRLALIAFLAAIHSVAADSTQSSAGRVIWDIPEALHLIRTADEVYIMPVTCTTKKHRAEVKGTYLSLTPHGDYKRLRLLGADARRKLGRLLGSQSSWFHGFDNTISIGPEPKNVGFIFRRGKDQLVLLCYMRWRFEGTFNGEHTGGSLEEKPSDNLDAWKEQYAKPELATK